MAKRGRASSTGEAHEHQPDERRGVAAGGIESESSQPRTQAGYHTRDRHPDPGRHGERPPTEELGEHDRNADVGQTEPHADERNRRQRHRAIGGQKQPAGAEPFEGQGHRQGPDGPNLVAVTVAGGRFRKRPVRRDPPDLDFGP